MGHQSGEKLLTFVGVSHSHHENGRVAQVNDFLITSKVEALHSLQLEHGIPSQKTASFKSQCSDRLRSKIYAHKGELQQLSKCFVL